MSYASLLAKHIEESGMTLEQIANECKRRGLTIHPTYISKLRLGNRAVPSKMITDCIADVLKIDSSDLIQEGLKEIICIEVEKYFNDDIDVKFEWIESGFKIIY